MLTFFADTLSVFLLEKKTGSFLYTNMITRYLQPDVFIVEIYLDGLRISIRQFGQVFN